MPQFDQPFRGVPILLKDGGEELEDTPYSLGTSVLRDSGYRSARTTELVRRLLDAGFIPVGKTNLPQLASGFTTEPEAFGPTRNPWDVTRTAGGSSGGSATAVAAGLVSIALGGDATGSLRVPAACCGVATLKPSRGLVPSATPADQPDLNGVWANFVLTRSIRDMAGVLEVVADIGAAPDADLPALRIGLLTHDPGSALEVHRDVVAAVEQAGWLLRARGHSVEAGGVPRRSTICSRRWRTPSRCPARSRARRSCAGSKRPRGGRCGRVTCDGSCWSAARGRHGGGSRTGGGDDRGSGRAGTRLVAAARRAGDADDPPAGVAAGRGRRGGEHGDVHVSV